MSKKRNVSYYLAENGKFIIENYDLAKPFASFFPGIAGLFGIPMWVFYVNRGQGIVSFGTQDKKNSILEFFPANRAWEVASSRGFRTFVKINGREVYEPFQNNAVNAGKDLQRLMSIGTDDFSVSESNRTLGLQFNARYFTLANEPLACLIRILTIKNTSKTKKTFEVIDGLPQVVPFGLSDRFIKELGRTMEAWMQVEFHTKFKVPCYKLSVDPTDRPQVFYIKGGNFYYSWSNLDTAKKKNSFIVDPEIVFGPVRDFSFPQAFGESGFKLPKTQITRSKTPSAFSHVTITLEPGREATLTSLIGHAQDEAHLGEFIAEAQNRKFLDEKSHEYKREVRKVLRNIFTLSADPTYDRYCQQTYLDNVLRGGLPITLPGKERSIYHVYSRKHGDLERDYNNFLTEATYFSQGNGNYRDVNQNRRNDVWFNTHVEDTNLFAFFNLIQLDGFNPLVVFGDRFKLRGTNEFSGLSAAFKNSRDSEKVLGYISQQFSLGGLFLFLEQQEIALTVEKEKFLESLLNACVRQENAEHGDGFWVDHWTYNLDALEAYLAIYPEKLKEVLIDKYECVYFNNHVKVKPRDEKYVLYNDMVRQYHAVSMEEIEEGSQLSKQISSDDWSVKTDYGKGPALTTTLLGKIVCLVSNKMASLDAFGCGIEMEANKPGWYDALNGLPGMFGSSVCESFELKRLVDFVINAINELHIDSGHCVKIPVELSDFLSGLTVLVDEWESGRQSDRDMVYWDKAYDLKEKYRKKIYHGISGVTVDLRIAALIGIFVKMSAKLGNAIARSKDKKTGLYHTYFINEVTDFEKIPEAGGFKTSRDGLLCVRPKKFKQLPLPLFLEAQVHALRCERDAETVKQLYRDTRKSALYDKALKMYKVNASLMGITGDIGRARAFTPGWLENESIWLHMEYKFILELLRHGLYDEFFAEFKNVLIPFQPAQRYGRSILENSSFLVSSAFPDKSLHGNGFVARLSGSTAEFITMWLWMNAGPNPFKLNANKQLVAEFAPRLPAWMFTKQECRFTYCAGQGNHLDLDLPKNSYAFNFLAATLVIYHNPKRKNTYGANGVKPVSMRVTGRDGKQASIPGAILPDKYAESLREGKILKIEVELA